jgi:hypothetical protein
MGECADCKNWILQRKTLYEDGSEIINYQSNNGLGHCEVLKVDTPLDFGCSKFEAGDQHYEILARKSGSPWHHSQWGKCPDCNGRGSDAFAACRRCCGTGRVLYYDDGYVGEESTRRHPNEMKGKAPPPPSCPACTKNVDREWVSCPYCGHRLLQTPERTSEEVTSMRGGALTGSMS